MSAYIKLKSDEMQEKIDLLLNLWYEFLKKSIPAYINECSDLGQPCEVLAKCKAEDTCYVNVFVLREVFERTHQREDYFERYHEHLKMSNFKEIGLIAFWIAKLKPFHLKADYFEDFFDAKINEEFALYFIFNAVARYAKERNKTYKVGRIDSELYNELLYTMQYRDLSKEAYGCLVELIYKATCLE